MHFPDVPGGFLFYNGMTMSSRGKFIAIEGTDGSGKTVQFERLIIALPERVKLGTLDFPRYAEPSSFFVQKYLSGRYGGEVGPYAAAIFYALDRFDSKLRTLQWLEEEERFVVANRYVGSNMAHQGAKIESKSGREKFYKWLHVLEYEIMGIPKPDLTIILHVPAEVSRELLTKTGELPDLHEADFEHQKRAEEVYLEIAALFPKDFKVIECMENGALLSPDRIHEKVWEIVRKVIGE
jgi:dTMP kinase